MGFYRFNFQVILELRSNFFFINFPFCVVITTGHFSRKVGVGSGLFLGVELRLIYLGRNPKLLVQDNLAYTGAMDGMNCVHLPFRLQYLLAISRNWPNLQPTEIQTRTRIYLKNRKWWARVLVLGIIRSQM